MFPWVLFYTISGELVRSQRPILEVPVRKSAIKGLFTCVDVSAFSHGQIHVRKKRNPLPTRSNHVLGYNPLPKLLYLSLPFFVFPASLHHLSLIPPLHVSPVYSSPPPQRPAHFAYPQHLLPFSVNCMY